MNFPILEIDFNSYTELTMSNLIYYINGGIKTTTNNPSTLSKHWNFVFSLDRPISLVLDSGLIKMFLNIFWIKVSFSSLCKPGWFILDYQGYYSLFLDTETFLASPLCVLFSAQKCTTPIYPSVCNCEQGLKKWSPTEGDLV